MNVIDALFFAAVLGLAGIFVYGLYVLKFDKSFNCKNEDATNVKN